MLKYLKKINIFFYKNYRHRVAVKLMATIMLLFIIFSISIYIVYWNNKKELKTKINEELEIITEATYNIVAVADQSMRVHLQTLSQKGLFLIKTKCYNDSISQEEAIDYFNDFYFDTLNTYNNDTPRVYANIGKFGYSAIVDSSSKLIVHSLSKGTLCNYKPFWKEVEDSLIIFKQKTKEIGFFQKYCMPNRNYIFKISDVNCKEVMDSLIKVKEIHNNEGFFLKYYWPNVDYIFKIKDFKEDNNIEESKKSEFLKWLHSKEKKDQKSILFPNKYKTINIKKSTIIFNAIKNTDYISQKDIMNYPSFDLINMYSTLSYINKDTVIIINARTIIDSIIESKKYTNNTTLNNFIKDSTEYMKEYIIYDSIQDSSYFIFKDITDYKEAKDKFKEIKLSHFDSLIIEKYIIEVPNSKDSAKIGWLTYFEPWGWISWASAKIKDIDAVSRLNYNLNQINTSLQEEKKGYIFVIDTSGYLIFHPNIGEFTHYTNSYRNEKSFKYIDYMIRTAKEPPYDTIREIEYEWIWSDKEKIESHNSSKNDNGIWNEKDKSDDIVSKRIYELIWNNKSENPQKRTKYKYYKELGWIVCCGFYEEKILEPIRNNYTILLTIFLVVSIYFIIVVFIIINSFLNPLMRLVDKVKRIGTHNFEIIESEKNRKDEIGDIYKSASEADDKIKKSKEENAKLAQKTVISAILGRNLSHTFGSHVIPAVNNELVITDNEKKHLKDDCDTILKDAINYFSTKYANIKNANSHLQARMEYIADISFSEPWFANTLYFEEVIKELFEANENQKFLKFISNNIPVKFVYESKLIDIEKEDIMVNFPNEMLGVQAFYSILINIISNAVKHSVVIKAGNKLRLYITIIVSKPENETDKDSLLCVDIIEKFKSENIETEISKDVVNDINNKLNKSIIDEKTKTITEGAWGLLEMKISAAYLRMITIDNIQNVEPPLIKAHYYSNGDNQICSNNTEAHLGYRLFLKKPKLCLIVLKENTHIENDRLKTLLSWGIKLINFSEDIESHITKDNQYMFIISDKNYYEITAYNNRRILNMNSNNYDDFINIIKNEDSFDLISYCLWKKWTEKLYENEKIPEIIYENTDNFNIENIVQGGAYFNWHGEDFKNFNFSEIKNSGLIFLEPYPSTSFSNILVRKLKKLNNNNLSYPLLCETVEAIKTKVVIIDERIQRSSAKIENNLPHLKISDVLYLMGIEVYDNEKIQRYTSEKDELKKHLEEYITEKLKDCETRFIVIHITLFEMICNGKEKNNLKEKLDYFESQICNHEKSIVFVSGKGTPSNLPGNSYYIHLSTIQNYILQNRSKFLLTKVLYALRRK